MKIVLMLVGLAISSMSVAGPWVSNHDIDMDDDEVTIRYGYRNDWDTAGAPASQGFTIYVYSRVYYNNNANSGRSGTSYSLVCSDEVSVSRYLELGDSDYTTIDITVGAGHKAIVSACIVGDGWMTYWASEKTEYNRF